MGTLIVVLGLAIGSEDLVEEMVLVGMVLTVALTVNRRRLGEWQRWWWSDRCCPLGE